MVEREVWERLERQQVGQRVEVLWVSEMVRCGQTSGESTRGEMAVQGVKEGLRAWEQR